MSDLTEITPNKDETKFASQFQLFDGAEGNVWVVFLSADGTQMAVNYVDIENVVKIKHQTEPSDNAPSHP